MLDVQSGIPAIIHQNHAPHNQENLAYFTQSEQCLNTNKDEGSNDSISKTKRKTNLKKKQGPSLEKRVRGIELGED